MEKKAKGRDKSLISLRDEQLIKRWFQLTEIERLRFDDSLKQLSEKEFFISEQRIWTIIKKNANK